MKRDDSITTVQELIDHVAKFRDERNWGKHHTPKNLAVSISIEAAELLELFQWDEYTLKDHANIEEELSDILIYCFQLADTLKIDVSTAFNAKLKKASEKYPVEKFNKNSDKSEDYQKIKQAYRNKK